VAKMIYSASTSLDGNVADEDGKFDWGEPDEGARSARVRGRARRRVPSAPRPGRGGRRQAVPDDVRFELELSDERRFGNAMVHLRYAIGT
jgi:hypothetical protein